LSRILVNTKDMPREEWLKYRNLGIGGSDAAAVVGLNPYVTPYKLWAEKTGRLPEEEENEAMRQGRDLEAYVASRFEESTGKKVRRRNVMYQHAEYDFVLANIDREVIGEQAGLECKTTSVMNLRKFKNGEFPDQYYVQCVHYLAVTGYKKWYLAVLVLNQGFYVYEINRDEAEIVALVAAEKEFWETYIVPDVAPEVDGYVATSKTIDRIFADAGGECELIGSTAIQNYLALKDTLRQIRKEMRKAEQQIKVELGECETGYCGDYTVKWQKYTKASISKEKLKKRYPKIDLSKIMKSTEFRRFSIKSKEEASQ
jgi:putative phage-type endonuclease